MDWPDLAGADTKTPPQLLKSNASQLERLKRKAIEEQK